MNRYIRMRSLKGSDAMFFYNDNQDFPTPEIDEAPPEKKGLRRFFELFLSNCGALLKANLLFLLGCLPIVTIPISLFALNRVALQIVLDQPVKCLRIYGETFRQYWKQSCLAFLLTVVPLVCAGYGMRFYFTNALSMPLLFLPFLVCSTIFLVTLLSSGCLYGLLAGGKSLREVLRLAPLLGIAKPQRTVPAALSCHGLLLFAVLFFPLSGLYLLIFGFALPCMLGNFFLRVILRPFIVTDEVG